MAFKTLEWIGGVDGYLRILDQTFLPSKVEYKECHDVHSVWEAIRELRVRGAPAIGIAAAYGVVLGARGKSHNEALQACDFLSSSRPTAVNLFWALKRMRNVIERSTRKKSARLQQSLLREAHKIIEEDRQVCHKLGEHGSKLLEDGFCVLTHCNAGALATSEYGTALAAIYFAVKQGKRIKVIVDETRPLLQGARLTAWELSQSGIDVTIICDGAAAHVISHGKVNCVITGCDRVVANGDAANKIGTLPLAIAAKEFSVPFYISAPLSSFDISIKEGKQIPIEERSTLEILRPFGLNFLPTAFNAYNPAFDVTPAKCITAIVTEAGILRPPYQKSIAKAVGN